MKGNRAKIRQLSDWNALQVRNGSPTTYKVRGFGDGKIRINRHIRATAICEQFLDSLTRISSTHLPAWSGCIVTSGMNAADLFIKAKFVSGGTFACS